MEDALRPWFGPEMTRLMGGRSGKRLCRPSWVQLAGVPFVIIAQGCVFPSLSSSLFLLVVVVVVVVASNSSMSNSVQVPSSRNWSGLT